jgi:hypothetical protein
MWLGLLDLSEREAVNEKQIEGWTVWQGDTPDLPFMVWLYERICFEMKLAVGRTSWPASQSTIACARPSSDFLSFETS